MTLDSRIRAFKWAPPPVLASVLPSLLALFLAFASPLLFPSLSGAAPLHIMLDPGHGGIDTGAAKGKLRESEIALKVALKLADLLRHDPRFKVSMTRTKNVTLTLPQRTEAAKEAGADLFLSIHLNSSTDPRVHGKEFYFQNQLPADEEAMFLASRENAENEVKEHDSSKERLSAKSDLKQIIEDLQRNERILSSSELSRFLFENWISQGRRKKTAIRQAPFYVVSNTHTPSVLVEVGYLTHAEEGPRLARDDYQSELAQSLYKGLTKFKETVDKDRSRPINSADEN
jgi:N-acetylmuramoyl-L-alanine amidase